jgi:LacI family transcriptional regulator
MQAILDEGLRIPEDIAIAGCGNVFYNTLMRVPLTSVNQNAALLGVEAAKLVLRVLRERLSKPQHSSTKVLLKPTLAVRASTVNETK